MVSSDFEIKKRTFEFRDVEFPYFEINLPEGRMDFKIAQLTDQHLGGGGFLAKQHLKPFKEPLAFMKTDLIINTGDLFSRNALWIIKWIIRTYDKYFQAIAPWTFAWGNHDTENFDRSGKCNDIEEPLVEIENYIGKQPNCLYVPTHNLFNQIPGETYEEEIKSTKWLTEEQRGWLSEFKNRDALFGGNFVITINSTVNGKTVPQFNLFILNTRRYLLLPEKVIEWMQDFINKKNPVESLLFYHVPNYEFHELWEDKKCVGIKRENVCYETDRGRMHSYFKQIPQIKAVFVGHDHVNDYWGVKDGIHYEYGRKSSTGSYGGRKDYVPEGQKGIKMGFKNIHLIFGPEKKIKIESICGLREKDGVKTYESCKEVGPHEILL